MFRRKAHLQTILLGAGLCACFATLPALGSKTSPALRALTLERLPMERIPGERVHVFIDKEAARLGKFPVHRVKAREIYAGQLLSMNENELTELAGATSGVKETDFDEYIFNVVKAGTEDEPFYQLLGGHNRIDRGLSFNRNLEANIRVLVDLSHFPEEEQEELLSIYGHFWSPENPDGKYQKLKIHHIVPSPWRSLVKVKKIKTKFESYLDERLVFPEIEFGRRLHEYLIERGFSEMELLTTAQVVDALLSTLSCEKNLKSKR